MISCDVVLAYNKNDVCYQAFIAYDRQLLVGADIFGVKTTSLKQLLREADYIVIITAATPLTYVQRKKVTDTLYAVLNKEVSLSFKERFNFLKYIYWVHEGIAGNQLFEHASIPKTINELLDSHFTNSVTLYSSVSDSIDVYV